MPPGAPELKNPLLRRLHTADHEPVAARERQNKWYRWRTRVIWAQHWNSHASQWQRTLSESESEMNVLAKALLGFARNDEENYSPRVAELYRHRVGVSYLLPLGGTTMEQFYVQVRQRLIGDLAEQGKMPPAATEAGLVQALASGSGGWAQAYQTSLEKNPEQAVTDLRDLLKEHVKTCLRDITGGRSPLLPRLSDLVAEAASHHGSSADVQENVEDFRNKLAGLVPAAFTPQGNGPMKILISYPADAPSPAVETYLQEWLNLPVLHNAHYDMKPTLAESITVVLFRSSMGITEIDEVRDVLRLWSRALNAPEPADFLRWRQRTGFKFGYLATTPEHRVEILHRLLCALWNGKVTAEGDQKSPERIRVEFSGGVTMTLRLTPLDSHRRGPACSAPTSSGPSTTMTSAAVSASSSCASFPMASLAATVTPIRSTPPSSTWPTSKSPCSNR